MCFRQCGCVRAAPRRKIIRKSVPALWHYGKTSSNCSLLSLGNVIGYLLSKQAVQ